MPIIILQPAAPGSQVLLIPDGSVLLPGLAFNSDTSTGIFRPDLGSPSMGFAVNGLEIFRMYDDGIYTGAGKRLYFKSDDDTSSVGLRGQTGPGGANYEILLPNAAPANNNLAKIDVSGQLSWGKVDLANEVSGILPVANGGTGTNDVLNNNRVMVSAGGLIVEASAITGDRALISNANGIPIASAVTQAELAFVSGVTSAIQTQLNALSNGKIDKSTLSAKGSLVGASAASTPVDVPVGANNTQLVADSANANGLRWANDTVNIQTTVTGDVADYISIADSSDSGKDKKCLLSDVNLPANRGSGELVQHVHYQTGALATFNSTIPVDDTIPQNTEGTEVMSLAITPKSATNKLYIEVTVNFANSAASTVSAPLFQDSTANALATGGFTETNAGFYQQIKYTHEMVAGTTSATTFKVRMGHGGSGTISFNGSAGVRAWGGVTASSISIREEKP